MGERKREKGGGGVQLACTALTVGVPSPFSDYSYTILYRMASVPRPTPFGVTRAKAAV
jgi:hypothetical protein